jgi:hypothetical protein
LAPVWLSPLTEILYQVLPNFDLLKPEGRTLSGEELVLIYPFCHFFLRWRHERELQLRYFLAKVVVLECSFILCCGDNPLTKLDVLVLHLGKSVHQAVGMNVVNVVEEVGFVYSCSTSTQCMSLTDHRYNRHQWIRLKLTLSTTPSPKATHECWYLVL